MLDLDMLSVMSLWTAATLYVIAMFAYSIKVARVADDRIRVKRGQESSGKTAGKAAGIARTTMVVGAAMHLVGIIARTVEAGHAPWSNMYEYTISGVWVGVVVFLWLQRSRNVGFAAPAVAASAAFGVITALHVFYLEVVGLQVALDSYWLVIHVPIAVIASGIFGVSGIISATQLVKARQQERAASAAVAEVPAADATPKGLNKLLEAVPSVGLLDSLAFRLNAVGFVLWTFTIVSGAMWAEDAWGRFWGWDPKEVWSFVIWVLYAAYLHARTTQGWMGKRAAWLAIAGFVAIILNFTAVNMLLQGLHSYSGL